MIGATSFANVGAAGGAPASEAVAVAATTTRPRISTHTARFIRTPHFSRVAIALSDPATTRLPVRLSRFLARLGVLQIFPIDGVRNERQEHLVPTLLRPEYRPVRCGIESVFWRVRIV